MRLKMPWMVIVSMVGLALAVAAPAAVAATATIADPAGDIAYSFDQSTDLTQLVIVWDGSLRVVATYAQPPRSSRLNVLVSTAAEEEHDETVRSCDAEMSDSLTVTASGDQAALEIPGVGGTLTADAQWTGTTVAYVFSSSTLSRIFAPGMRDPFACADGSADGDTFYGGFAGKTLKLTPAVAKAGARAELARRYGTRFTSSPRTLIRCLRRAVEPAAEAGASWRAARAWCAFEFKRGASARSGEVALFLDSGVPRSAEFFSRVLPSGLRACGTTDFSSGPNGRRWLNPPFPPSFGGAYMTVWSQRVPCNAARTTASRWNGKRRFRGYRCTVLKRGHEFLAVSCKRPGGRLVRWETGA